MADQRDRKEKTPGAGGEGHAAPTAPAVHACNELGAMFGSELAEVEEEIERVGSIIGEAVGTLSTGFDRIHAITARQRGGMALSSEDAGELEQAVSSVVRALQFEDIAAQALAEARRSLAYLRDVAEEVEAVHDASELAAKISREHAHWSHMRRKAVLQKDLDEGDVDLF